jgi:hypothetical protein
MEYDLTSSVFGLRRPEGLSDEVIVAELEQEASDILGPWNRKKYLSLVEVCKRNLRLNRCLAEMVAEGGGNLRARRLRLRGPRALRGRRGMRRFLREIALIYGRAHGDGGREIVVPEGRLLRSRYDLSDEYGTMLFGSGRRVEVAKALINLYCSPEGIMKRRWI